VLIEIGIAIEIEIGSIGEAVDNDTDPDFDFDLDQARSCLSAKTDASAQMSAHQGFLVSPRASLAAEVLFRAMLQPLLSAHGPDLSAGSPQLQ